MLRKTVGSPGPTCSVTVVWRIRTPVISLTTSVSFRVENLLDAKSNSTVSTIPKTILRVTLTPPLLQGVSDLLIRLLQSCLQDNQIIRHEAELCKNVR